MVIAPLVGVIITGKKIGPYLEFPPRTIYVQHHPFSWPVFISLAMFELASLVPVVRHLLNAFWKRCCRFCIPLKMRALPWWGWLAAFSLVVSWIIAWNRFPCMAPVQVYTYIPIWFSFIFLVNGVTNAIKGSCLMTRFRTGFLLMFPLSALFWWYFEYLNRFVQNWYYLGVDDFTPLGYVVTASISFSTVLPAVLSVHELILCLTGGASIFKRWVPVRIPFRRGHITALLLLSLACLSCISIYPDQFFWLLWVSPMIAITSLDYLYGREVVFSPAAQGDWSRLISLAFAGLICGFFWEMWNYHSQAKWIYMIPYVGRFHIFEMPLLGYGGYLPFGVECWLVGRLALPNRYWEDILGGEE